MSRTSGPLSPGLTAALHQVEEAIRAFQLLAWTEAGEPTDTCVMQSMLVVSHWQEIDADTDRVVSMYPVILDEGQPPHLTQGLLLMASETLEEYDAD